MPSASEGDCHHDAHLSGIAVTGTANETASENREATDEKLLGSSMSREGASTQEDDAGESKKGAVGEEGTSHPALVSLVPGSACQTAVVYGAELEEGEGEIDDVRKGKRKGKVNIYAGDRERERECVCVIVCIDKNSVKAKGLENA